MTAIMRRIGALIQVRLMDIWLNKVRNCAAMAMEFLRSRRAQRSLNRNVPVSGCSDRKRRVAYYPLVRFLNSNVNGTFISLDSASIMVKHLVMEAAIAEVKKNLCSLVDRVEQGETVIILRHGRPAAQLVPIPGKKRRHAVAHDDFALYKGIILEEPIMEPIE
jgi:prevent-host-death family protein